MLYTSYFSNSRKLKNKGISLVAISRSVPKNFEGERLISLAPTWEMLKMSDEDYNKNYEMILNRNSREEIFNRFKDRDVAFLCWEKDENQCHRKRFAEWLREGGYDIQEFVEKKNNNEYEQLMMF